MTGSSAADWGERPLSSGDMAFVHVKVFASVVAPAYTQTRVRPTNSVTCAAAAAGADAHSASRHGYRH